MPGGPGRHGAYVLSLPHVVVRIARERALPFEPLIPRINHRSDEGALRGALTTVVAPDNLLGVLNREVRYASRSIATIAGEVLTARNGLDDLLMRRRLLAVTTAPAPERDHPLVGEWATTGMHSSQTCAISAWRRRLPRSVASAP